MVTESLPSVSTHIGILRCETWHRWQGPLTLTSGDFDIYYGPSEKVCAKLILHVFPNQPEPEHEGERETNKGLLIWSGESPGLARLGDALHIAAGENSNLILPHRNGYYGEIDICIAFPHEGKVNEKLRETVNGIAHAVRALICIYGNDFLSQTAPFSMGTRSEDGTGGTIETAFIAAAHDRLSLSENDIKKILLPAATLLPHCDQHQKLITALEIYASHIGEPQIRVRFLLLIIAIETLTTESRKHTAAQGLLDKWIADINCSIEKYSNSEDAQASLLSLKNELFTRKADSIGAQIGRLFAELPGIDNANAISLRRRALRVYAKRSTLVHTGTLPQSELRDAEHEARDLFETAVKALVGVPT